MKKTHLLALLVLISCETDSTGEKVEYYDDGEVKSKIMLQNGKPHGEAINYYQSGQVNTLLNYRNGLLDGNFKSFYSNGTLEVEGEYKDGEYIGTLKHFFKNGNLKEKKIYKDGGNLWYILKLDEKGDTIYNQIVPYFKVKSDTISFGENYEINVIFGANINHETKVYVGYPGENFSFEHTLDTLTFSGDRFSYKYKPDTKGTVTIGFLFEKSVHISDSTNLYNIFPKHSFYVRD